MSDRYEVDTVMYQGREYYGVLDYITGDWILYNYHTTAMWAQYMLTTGELQPEDFVWHTIEESA